MIDLSSVTGVQAREIFKDAFNNIGDYRRAEKDDVRHVAEVLRGGRD